MFHKEDDTLDLLGQYTKRKEPIKTKPLESSKERIVYRDVGKFTTKSDKNNKNPLLKILGIAILAFVFFSAYKSTSNTLNNPILGKWRTNTVMGTMEIEFDKNTASALGGTSRVNYEIKDNKILVFDEDLKMGTYYTIHDQNTIYTDLMGIRTVYKRVK